MIWQSTGAVPAARYEREDEQMPSSTSAAILLWSGVGAVSADAGYSTSNLGEAAMMREMMPRAARVAILADSSKFGRRLFAQISELGAADYLITDSSPPPDLLEALSENDVEVITPETASSRSWDRLTFAHSRSHPDLAFVIFRLNSTLRGPLGRRISSSAEDRLHMRLHERAADRYPRVDRWREDGGNEPLHAALPGSDGAGRLCKEWSVP
jgi:DeoR C terminal sensor domain